MQFFAILTFTLEALPLAIVKLRMRLLDALRGLSRLGIPRGDMARRGIVAAEVIALHGAVELLRCGAALSVPRVSGRWRCAVAMRALVKLLHRRLPLRIAVRRSMLGGAEAARDIGLMRRN